MHRSNYRRLILFASYRRPYGEYERRAQALQAPVQCAVCHNPYNKDSPHRKRDTFPVFEPYIHSSGRQDARRRHARLCTPRELRCRQEACGHGMSVRRCISDTGQPLRTNGRRGNYYIHGGLKKYRLLTTRDGFRKSGGKVRAYRRSGAGSFFAAHIDDGDLR